VVHVADVGAVPDEVGPGGVDVRDRENQPDRAPGPGRGEALAEVNRALRVGRRELHDPEVVADGKVGIQPPAEVLVEALGPVDVGDIQRHDLEVQIGGRRRGHLGRGGAAYVGARHGGLH
jgi:hypothetical protein